MSNKAELIEKLKRNIEAIESIKELKLHHVKLNGWDQDYWMILYPRWYNSDGIQFAVVSTSHDIRGSSYELKINRDNTTTHFGYFSFASMWNTQETYVFNISNDIIVNPSNTIKVIYDVSKLKGEYKHPEYNEIVKEIKCKYHRTCELELCKPNCSEYEHL